MHIFIIFLIIAIIIVGIIFIVKKYYYSRPKKSEEVVRKNNSLYYIHNNMEEVSTKTFNDDNVTVYTIENFLSPRECDKLIESAQGKMSLSPLTSPTGDKNFRDSETCYFEKNNDFHKYIDQKISSKIGLSDNFSESSQIQHYRVGNQFKPHHDFFHPHDFENYAGKNSHYKGQRTWTFTVYLNDVVEGGETEFVEMGLKIKPKRGMAVVWNNLLENGDTNQRTLHCGKPVIRGEKYIITKWFRDRQQKI